VLQPVTSTSHMSSLYLCRRLTQSFNLRKEQTENTRSIGRESRYLTGGPKMHGLWQQECTHKHISRILMLVIALPTHLYSFGLICTVIKHRHTKRRQIDMWIFGGIVIVCTCVYRRSSALNHTLCLVLSLSFC
jgi:hypothetical protein